MKGGVARHSSEPVEIDDLLLEILVLVNWLPQNLHPENRSVAAPNYPFGGKVTSTIVSTSTGLESMSVGL